MNRTILVLIACLFVSFSYAQHVQQASLERIEADKQLNLSADQMERIKRLNQDYESKYETVGRSNLSGAEKSKRQKELAREHKASMKNILTDDQIRTWENHYGSMDNDHKLDEVVKNKYDKQIKQSEEQYKRDVKNIDNKNVSGDMKKREKESLKNKYKTEKDRLKDEKESALRSGLLSR